MSERLGELTDDELFARLPEDTSAREELLVRNRPLAEYLARRFLGRGEAMEDLAQVAWMALLKAIDRFDPKREVQFSTFATVTIVGELKRHLRDRGWAVRVPRRLQELGLRINKVLPELAQELGRSPTVSELAVATDLEEDEVLEAMEASQAYAADSLDAPVGGSEERATAYTLGAEDERLALMEGWATVAPVIEQLPPRERRILYLRFFEDRTQTEIAEEIGISQMHVSRLLAQSLAFLREHAGEVELP
jgi:RNA polymerase sigma-B factor